MPDVFSRQVETFSRESVNGVLHRPPHLPTLHTQNEQLSQFIISAFNFAVNIYTCSHSNPAAIWPSERSNNRHSGVEIHRMGEGGVFFGGI